MIHYKCLDRPLHLKSAADMITTYAYPKPDQKAPDIFRIGLKDEVLANLTRDLYRPKTTSDETARILHIVNGMIVRLVKDVGDDFVRREKMTEAHRPSIEHREEAIERRKREEASAAAGASKADEGQYVFVGYVSQPSFYIQVAFGQHGLYAVKPKTDSHRKTPAVPVFNDDNLKAHDYSSPYDDTEVCENMSCSNLSEDEHCPFCVARMKAYMENVECFSTRTRGEYFCIFRSNKQLFAANETEMFPLQTPSNLIDHPYEKKAALLIYALAGFNFDKFRDGETVSNHTETSYMLACIRSPLSVFGRERNVGTSGSDVDVFYVESSLSAGFYLNGYMGRTFKLYKWENVYLDGNLVDTKKIPYSDTRWVRSFVGHKEFMGHKRPLRMKEEEWRLQDEERDSFTGSAFSAEYESLVVYDGFLCTNVVFCTPRDYLIEILTHDDSNVFDVAKRIIKFFNDGTIKTKQYTATWPTEYKTVFALANNLFRNSKLNRLLLKMTTEDPRSAPTDSRVAYSENDLKAIILSIYGSDLPVAHVAVKVSEPFILGEHMYRHPDGQVGRLIVSNKETSNIGDLTGVLSRTIRGNSYSLKLTCRLLEENNKRFLVVREDDILMLIASTKDRITRFLYACVMQTEKGLEHRYQQSHPQQGTS